MPGFAEKLLIRLLFTAVVLFLSVHIMADSGGTERETIGTPAMIAGEWTCGSQVVTFFLRDYSLMPHLKVLVNGEERGKFQNRYVTVAVTEGDFISIDSTFYSRPASIEVLDVSQGLKNPGKGEVFRLKGNVAAVGIVRRRAG